MKIGKENGAIAGKLTGAGRGGSYVIAQRFTNSEKYCKSCRKAGAAHTWIENLGG